MQGVFAGHEKVGGFAWSGRKSEEVFTGDFKSVGLIEAEGDRVFTPYINRDFRGGGDQGVIEDEIEEVGADALALVSFAEVDAVDVFGKTWFGRAELDEADGKILI